MDRTEILKGPGGIISKVYNGTIAEEIDLKEGDVIYRINNQPVRDLIDFEFLWAEENVELLILRKDSEEFELIDIEKDYDEELGVEFTSGVFDKVRLCKNNCIFCFVDQMPSGMRKSLYEKDDDYRLSFLQGNFITLTNLTDEDKKRIIDQKLSPLFVSVQSADGKKREELLRNPQAAKIIEDLKELTSAGIEIHTQIVLCKGINDGVFLEHSIKKIESISKNIISLAIVPAGITKYRKNSDLFPEFTKEEAEDIIDKVHHFQEQFKEIRGNNFVYLGDEFYIKGKRKIPDNNEYDGFPQLENGIGLSRIFIDEFEEFKDQIPFQKDRKEKIYLVSGKSPEAFLQEIVLYLNKNKNLNVDLLALENHFFGKRVTVTGLLTGGDLLNGLHEIPKGSRVLIPDVMLKKGENLFLDDLKVEELSEKLGIEIEVFDSTFGSLIEKILKMDRGSFQ